MANNFGRVNVSITASTGGLTAGLADAGRQLSAFRRMSAGTSGSFSALNAAAQESEGLFTDIPGVFGSFAASVLGMGRSATMAAVGVRVLTLALKTLLVPLLIVQAITAPFRALGEAAASLDAAGKAARRLGMSVSTFQTLSQVANEAGVSTEQFAGLMTTMTRSLGALANGSATAQKAFVTLGLTLKDLQNLDPQRQFELIAKRIMALPTAAERTSAAIAIFGRNGAQAMGFIEETAKGANAEVEKMRQAFGVNLTDSQVAGIQQMNDAIGRLALPMQGFINQFLAELAPAITTVSNLIVGFFAKNTAGWTIAKTLADGLVFSIRMVVGAMTLLTGIFQVFMAFGSQIGQMFSEVFSIILDGVTNVMEGMAGLAEAAGFTGLADSLAQGAQGAAQLADGASQMGAMYGQAAADTFASAVQNIGSPFAAFDREFAQAQSAAQQSAAAAAGAASGSAAGQSIGAAIKAASSELSALVVGSSGGESYRNMLARGGDPRLSGADAAKQTADNTERAADGIEDVAAAVREIPGFGQAQLAMV
jgi:hypothetical protein